MSVPTVNDPEQKMTTQDTQVGAVKDPTEALQAPPSAAPGDLAPNAPISATGAPAGKLPANGPAPTTAPAQEPVQTVKHHVAGILRSVLNTLGESLGGPAEVQGYGPNGETRNADGTPIMEHRGTGQRIMSALGKEMVGISAGMGQARGPGGVGRATAASAEAVLELQEKNKMYSMQMHTQHANDLAAYRHQMAEDGEAMDKNINDHAGFVNLIKGSNKAIAVNDGQPMNFKDASDYMGQMLQQGWKMGDLLQFAGPKEKNVPSPNNPQGIGYHPTFYVFRANKQTPPGGESLAQQKVTVENAELAKKLMVAEGSQVPLYLAAKVGTEDVALNNGSQAIKRSLQTAGINIDDLPKVPTDPMERQKDAAAMQALMKQKDWQPGGNVTPAFRELQASNPELADRVSKYFGKPDNIWKAEENLKLAEEKRDQINKDPEKALATPEYRGLMAKNIGIMKYLDAQQKKVYMDEINQIPNMTVSQATAFVNMVTGEDFKAMQAKAAQDARAQQASDARAERELQRQLKEGEEATPEETQATVEAIGQARQQMSPALARTPQGRAIMGQVNLQYRNYDATLFPTYEKMRESFVSGRDGRTLEAISKVTQHMRLMHDTVTSGSTGWTGAAMGSIQGIMGIDTDAGRRAQSLKPMVTGISTELDKAYSQGATTISGIDAWLKTVDSQTIGQNPKKIHERLSAGMELMRGQIAAEGEKWAHGMPQHKDGTPVETPFPLVSDDFRANYEAITGKQIDNWGNNPTKTTNTPAPIGNFKDGPGTYFKSPDGGWRKVTNPEAFKAYQAKNPGTKFETLEVQPQ